jgi:hypothetical protein
VTFHAEKSVKKLFGIHRVEGPFQRLDKFTQQEARMAEVEILAIATRIDENLIHVHQLEGVHTNIQGVGHEVGFLNTGDLFFSSLAPQSASSALLG